MNLPARFALMVAFAVMAGEPVLGQPRRRCSNRPQSARSGSFAIGGMAVHSGSRRTMRRTRPRLTLGMKRINIVALLALNPPPHGQPIPQQAPQPYF